MIIGNVIGNIWATKKDEGLNGSKLLIVEPINVKTQERKMPIVAADIVGAGIGEMVLLIQGGSARHASPNVTRYAVDAVIVGIVDGIDLKKEG
ncbi:MAG: EutN/CcmL family microcompartment protein [Treponemataceae bacterium]